MSNYLVPGSAFSVRPLYIGQYYKSTAQTLTNGNTDITFDLTSSWNNTGGFITHANGTKDFTVVQPGLYQLDVSCLVLANGATYTAAAIGKSLNIDITRSPSAEQSIIGNTAYQTTTQNYNMTLSGTFYLNGGDVINLRVGNTWTGGGPPTLAAVANTYDLNTFFTWTFLN